MIYYESTHRNNFCMESLSKFCFKYIKWIKFYVFSIIYKYSVLQNYGIFYNSMACPSSVDHRVYLFGGSFSVLPLKCWNVLWNIKKWILSRYVKSGFFVVFVTVYGGKQWFSSKNCPQMQTGVRLNKGGFLEINND